MKRLRSAAALGVCLLAAACTQKWAPQSGPVPQAAASQQGRRVRLSLTDGTQVELTHMRVEADSILGVASAPPRHYAVATEDVQAIAVPEGDPMRGVSMMGAISIAATVVTLLLLVELFARLP
jgi:hypothetical protein